MPSPGVFHAPYDSITAHNHTQEYAPCDGLPVELIAHIFLSGGCRAPDEICLKWPVVLSSVCRRWRKIAMSTQKLWQHINPTADSAGLPLTKHYLERALSCDLYIDMNFFDAKYPTTEVGQSEVTGEAMALLEYSRVEEAIQVLSPHIARWKELYLTVRFSQSLDTFGHQLLFAPRLEDLHVGYIGDDPESSNYALPTIALRPDATPALKSLFLDGVEPVIAEGPYLPQPVRHPTEISLNNLPRCAPYTLAQLLSHFDPEYLEFYEFGLSTQVAIPMMLPNLKELAILHLPNPSDIIPLFELMRAPNLDKLTLHGDFEAFGCSEVLRVLANSSTSYTSLATLVLYWWSYTSESRRPSSDDWIKFFAHYRQIETLFVRDMNLDVVPMLNALSDTARGHLLLPNFKHLGLRDAKFNYISTFLERLGAHPRRAGPLLLTLHTSAPPINYEAMLELVQLLGDWGILDLGYIRELECWEENYPEPGGSTGRVTGVSSNV